MESSLRVKRIKHIKTHYSFWHKWNKTVLCSKNVSKQASEEIVTCIDRITWFPGTRINNYSTIPFLISRILRERKWGTSSVVTSQKSYALCILLTMCSLTLVEDAPWSTPWTMLAWKGRNSMRVNLMVVAKTGKVTYRWEARMQGKWVERGSL